MSVIRQANSNDTSELLSMAEAFNIEDGHPFTPETRDALTTLIERPEWGAVWIILAGDDVAGYLVVCYGYSVEFCGRDAILDEIFVVPEHRGKGLGAQALKEVEDRLHADGFKALHLEVMRDNSSAIRFYERMGFDSRDTYFYSRRLGK